MEILIQNIDPWVTEEDLYRRIATALHTRPVHIAGSPLTNFRLLLLPQTGRGRHKGYAFLTIAEVSTARALVECYNFGKKALPLTISRDSRHNTVRLISNGFGRDDVIRDILRYAYEDWDERQRRLRGEPSSSNSSDDDVSGIALLSTTHRVNVAFAVSARHEPARSASTRQVQVRDRNAKCLLASSKLQQRIHAEEERLKRRDARQVFHVTITPTRTLLEGPFMDASNRVLRLFPEFGSHFLRVAFCDEDGDRFPVSRHDFADDIDTESFVRERIGTPLKEGIDIAGRRRFEALAWSGSGLGSHHCWFVTAFTDKDGKWWNADRIRQSLGDFSRVEKQPARFGARLSQAFSATSSTIRISDDWIKIVPDDHSQALMPSNGRAC